MHKITLLGAAIPLMLALAGCENDVERAAVGAGVGAVAAEATGNSPVVGAAVGAGVGAVSDDIRRRY